jgi:hypothetical protein
MAYTMAAIMKDNTVVDFIGSRTFSASFKKSSTAT